MVVDCDDVSAVDNGDEKKKKKEKKTKKKMKKNDSFYPTPDYSIKIPLGWIESGFVGFGPLLLITATRQRCLCWVGLGCVVTGGRFCIRTFRVLRPFGASLKTWMYLYGSFFF